jgi:hypothetical protein
MLDAMKKRKRSRWVNDPQLHYVTNVVRRDFLIMEIESIWESYRLSKPKSGLEAEIDRQTGYGEFRAKETISKMLDALHRMRRVEIRLGMPTDITDTHISAISENKESANA